MSIVSTPATPQSAVATQRFSTSAFAPHERLAAWREAYGRTIAKLEFEPSSEDPVTVDATLRTVPGLAIASLATLGLQFSKPANLIDTDDLILVIVETGGYSGRQLGREVNLRQGDAVIRLNAEITSGEIFGRPSIIRVPTRAIARKVGDVSAGVQRRIPADSDALRLLRQYMRAMEDIWAEPDVQHVAANHVHDLIALLLGSSREAAEIGRGGSVRAARLQAIKDDIARNVDDDMSPAAIAKRHGVTPRYVQKLFEGEGMTMSEYVLEQRLVRAHRFLSDPHRAHEKIATVAHAAGFGDLSHFYRAFRRQFGMLPADVRAGATRQLMN